MNDPAAVETTILRSDEPEQAAAAGFGYALAQARVRAGLSVEQAAARIRLHRRQLQALENEDLPALPAPAYINGFIRNYAREVGIDPVPLIEDLNAKLKLRGLSANAPDLGPAAAVPARALDERAWRHLVLAGIALTLLCALLIGVWIAHDRRGQASAPAPAPTPSPQQGAAEPAPASPAAGAASAGAEPPAANAPAQGPAGAAAATSTVTAPAAVAPVAAGAPAPAPVAAAAPPAADNKAAGAIDPHVPVATVSAAAAAGAGLVLRFTDRSWVEVSQGGRVLLSRNDEAGSMEMLNAAPPLMLVVGRADAVSVQYRGQEVNLKPYANSAGVARVVLADGRGAGGGPTNR